MEFVHPFSNDRLCVRSATVVNLVPFWMRFGWQPLHDHASSGNQGAPWLIVCLFFIIILCKQVCFIRSCECSLLVKSFAFTCGGSVFESPLSLMRMLMLWCNQQETYLLPIPRPLFHRGFESRSPVLFGILLNVCQNIFQHFSGCMRPIFLKFLNHQQIRLYISFPTLYFKLF